jgi:hypothetical protein
MTPFSPPLGKHIMDGVKPKREVLPGEYAGVRRAVRTQQKRIGRKIVLSALHLVELTHAIQIAEAEERGPNLTQSRNHLPRPRRTPD